MKSNYKYLFLAFAGWAAVTLGGCSLFSTGVQGPKMQQENTERIQAAKESTEEMSSMEETSSIEIINTETTESETTESEFTKTETTETETTDTGIMDGQTTGERPSGEDSREITSPETREEAENSSVLDKEVEVLLDGMPLEDKVAQLFILYPESLVEGVNKVTAAGEMTKKALDRRPVCGLIYMRQNLESKEQVQTMFSNFQKLSLERTGLPAFLCVDEEGGSVASVAKAEALGIVRGENMADIGARNQPEEAFAQGEMIGGYLAELGFNVDFAPVADVLSNPENTVVKKRSFGSDPAAVTAMAAAFSDGLKNKGILSCYKHFPGHGATAGDTHKGYAYTDKTLDELKACELLPFVDGIARNVPMVMIGHISLPQVIGDDTPASLSSKIMTDLLRKELGYEGIIITDALAMNAVIHEYSSGEAAVKALEAGADILLLPENFEQAYQGVLTAVEEGRLSQERIDQSLRRIIRQKLRLMEQMEEATGTEQKEDVQPAEKSQEKAEPQSQDRKTIIDETPGQEAGEGEN